MGITSREAERQSHSCAGAIVNGVCGLSVEQGISQQRHTHKQVYVGIKTRDAYEGCRGTEGAHVGTVVEGMSITIRPCRRPKI